MRKSKKMKIKLKNPIRMLGAVILIFLLVFGGIQGVKYLSSVDPTQKEIEKLENQSVKIISKKIVASVPNGEVLNAGVIEFSVSYNYSVAGGTIKPYTQKTGLKIVLSDTTLANIVNNNSIQISNNATNAATLQVTVTYKKLTETFNYTVKVPATSSK